MIYVYFKSYVIEIICSNSSVCCLLKFQVSLCFQKIAAEILGIRLTKNEMEQHSVSFIMSFAFC